MLKIDISLIVQMLNFIVLLLILNIFIYKPVMRILDERRGRVRESEDTVRDLEAKAADRWRAYEESLQRARIEANQEKERIKAEGIDSERRLLEEVRAETTGLVENARRQVGEEVARARELLRSEAETIALEMAEKILGRDLR